MGKKRNSNYTVGYSKPPRKTRFQPGQSGNPSGRPKKKPKTLTEFFELALNTVINTNENGKPMRMTVGEAIARQQVIMAARGEHKAAALVLKVVAAKEGEQVNNLPPILEVMRELNKKYKTDNQAGDDDSDNSDPREGE